MRYFRRSKRILVYINLLLSISLLHIVFVLSIFIRQLPKLGLNEAQKIVDSLHQILSTIGNLEVTPENFPGNFQRNFPNYTVRIIFIFRSYCSAQSYLIKCQLSIAFY